MQQVDLEIEENLEQHRTDGFSHSKTLVVRRGAPFRVSLPGTARPFDTLRVKIMLGRLYVTVPVSPSPNCPPSRWGAFMDPEGSASKPSVFIWSPASASVGRYTFKMLAFVQDKLKFRASGKFILLCNPWCRADSVFIPFEDQREEYIQDDSSLLFMGTSTNIVSRPWSLDQFEPDVLEACLNLLDVSPQHQRNEKRDYLYRKDPVYISRVVSAMINCEDDRGVLKGNWSGDFSGGVHASSWTGSGDILRSWAQSGFRPVKYGQCWVFAAVMCTVMRVLGIPCRVVTNFNSAHDTNGNLVIEEFYSETGKKLKSTKDSIWNFHVWVECWMTRRDLDGDTDGWQVLDPTPQQRSRGVFCCGPAPVKAIKERRVNLVYDVPFVYAEVNADVHTSVVSQGRVVSRTVDTERVGPIICTKAVGFPRMHNITGDYKNTKSPFSTLTSNSSSHSESSTLSRNTDKTSAVLMLDKPPVAGAVIRFTVKVVNGQRVAKMMKVHLNAQIKEYNNSPADTFWENHGVLQLGPLEVKILRQQILPEVYEDVVGDDMVNLAAVLEDVATHERVLAFQEFNVTVPELIIEIQDEDNVTLNCEHAATVAFSNPFSHPVSGVLSVSGAGLLRGHVNFRMFPLRPGGSGKQRINILPTMAGRKMLQASLMLSNKATVRGFKMVSVRRP
ncbi:transglutaminase 5, like [Corythoichthys intestinalis]|uniref:transglutaminase 5, like n=1 Tax=Corythoichthys intestinalis TaxID=161448 RepID=UPI0025A4EEB0|nr:transglutaminase 5, like [Corythoichthys intestinalis]XP_061814240.1 protein-glutamine gamma-glutamyltransferase 2-like [Nerophis lumbriciformis]